MRTITALCMAIVLFSALASARLGDDTESVATSTLPVPDSTIRTTANPTVSNATEPKDTTEDDSDVTTSNTTTSNTTTPGVIPLNETTPTETKVPTTTNVVDFLSGVWEAIGLGHDFEDFQSCIQEAKNAGTQLQKAMTFMNGSSAQRVSNGLNRLDKVIQPLVAGLRACNMTNKYIRTVNQIINKFTEAENLTIRAGSSIQVGGIEVYPDIAAAVDACDVESYASCGLYIGNAMGKAFYECSDVTSNNKVEEINSTPNLTWEAADFPQFKTMNLWKFKKNRLTLRRKRNLNNTTSSPEEEDDSRRRNLATIPATFDARTNWLGCIFPIRDQGNCGSCWAFAATEVLTDRFCIATNKSIRTMMAPQYLISCDSNNMACIGGYIDRAWSFLENSGDVAETCWPYKSSNGAVPTCGTFTKCANNAQLTKYYARRYSTKVFTTPAAIQQEIMTNGPVEAGMDVYSDFMNYKSGIYTKTAGATYAGGHAVKIVGWGNSNGIDYWIVANSWGTYWGESGYFRIAFGSCNIDSGVYAGLPDLTRS